MLMVCTMDTVMSVVGAPIISIAQMLLNLTKIYLLMLLVKTDQSLCREHHVVYL